MSTPQEFTVMGEDGGEYGPVTAEQIRKWIAEGRLEKKTPVKHADAKDWIFLGTFTEFSDAFEKVVLPPPPQPATHHVGVTLLAIAIVLVAVVIYVLLKVTPH